MDKKERYFINYPLKYLNPTPLLQESLLFQAPEFVTLTTFMTLTQILKVGDLEMHRSKIFTNTTRNVT